MKRAELVTFEQDPQMLYVLVLGGRRRACRVLEVSVLLRLMDEQREPA